MAEFMAILDFPPAPKLNIYGELDRTRPAQVIYAVRRFLTGKLGAPPAILPLLHRQQHAQPHG